MKTERAILAGGCFWGMQDLIRRYDGVVSTRVGYTGGNIPNATYRNHGTHAEAIEVIFDPARLSYRQLLEFFFQIVLMLGLGLPERTGGRHFGDDLARPQAGSIDIGDGVLSDPLLFLARVEDR